MHMHVRSEKENYELFSFRGLFNNSISIETTECWEKLCENLVLMVFRQHYGRLNINRSEREENGKF
jgi:hypothetical protein